MADDKARADALAALREFRDALAAGKPTRKIEDRFSAALDRIAEAAVRDQLDIAFQELNNADSERLFQAYAAVAGKIQALQDDFSLGAEVAKNGRKGLFFPTAAAYLGRIEGLLAELKEAAETVRTGVDEIRAGGAAAEDAFRAGDVDGLIDAGFKISEMTDALVASLKDIRTELSG